MGKPDSYGGWYAGVEGPDGVGKTTLMNLAKEYAARENIDAEWIREPGGSELGEALRDILLHKGEYNLSPQAEAGLLLANRLDLVHTKIIPSLKNGKHVITDRRQESSFAMQTGKPAEIVAQELGLEEWFSMEELIAAHESLLPEIYKRPNGLVLLEVRDATRRARMAAKALSAGHDKIESRPPDYSDAVHENYRALHAMVPHATVINAEQDPEEVFKQARPILFGPEHA